MNRKQRRAAAKQPHTSGPARPQLVEEGLRHHQAGQLDRASVLYRQVLALQPNEAEALHLLGVLRHQQGNSQEAVELIAKAIAIKPDIADWHSNLGIALAALGRFDEAVSAYHCAIAIRPDFPEAHNNLGNTLKDGGRLNEAVGAYRQAIAIKPNYPDAHNGLGAALYMLGQPAEAETSFREALRLQPNFPDAHRNLGMALTALSKHDAAVGAYRQAIASRPAYAEAHGDLATPLKNLGRLDEAVNCLRQAIAIKPNVSDWHSNLGIALVALGRLDEALASLDEAIALKPDYAEAFNNRGNALQELKRFDEALASYERALALKPDHAHALSGIIGCVNMICDWRRKTALADGAISHVSERKSTIAPLLFLGCSGEPTLQLQCSKNYIERQVPLPLQPLWTGATWCHDKVRVAYLSADFYQHATAYLMAELFERHDRSRFEIIGVSLGRDDSSDVRRRLVAAFDQFHDVRKQSDEEVAKLLHDLQVDIAIDLKGYTQDARPGILAYRPAPIQASYLGFPGTMGAEFIDYIIADKTVAPFEHQPFYTEKIVQLPDCYQVNDSKRKIAERTPTRPEAGLPQQGFVFCCFNNNWKITPDVFEVWMRLLHVIEGSVLWLLGDNESAERNLRREAQARGIDPSRLVFARRLPLDEHLARHRLADLFLDTLPCNAHTTASDALWAGLPVLTRAGTAFAGRVAASLLYAVGLPELVTHSFEDYEALALRLARDPSLLQGYRDRLATNRLTHPLFDTDRFRRHIEAAYRQMWEIWQHGEQPRSFAVEMQQ